MPDLPANAELMPSLGRLARGLSALFWGLPLALLICAKTAVQDWLRPLGMMPALASALVLVYGLTQLAHFQRQERVWIAALERAKLLAWLNAGLAPFLYWWNQLPAEPFFAQSVLLMALSGILFLIHLNHVLDRLAAMLPDETVRSETRVFTTFNRSLLAFLLGLAILYVLLGATAGLFPAVEPFRAALEWGRQWILLSFFLLPVAMTMSLLWKIKEAVLAGVFRNG